MPNCAVCRSSFHSGSCPVCSTEAAHRVSPLALRAPSRTARRRMPAIDGHPMRPLVRASDGLVEGAIIQTHGPTTMPARRDLWRSACVVFVILLLLPVGVAVCALAIAVQLALRILLGFGRTGGHRSFLDDIIFFRGLEGLTRRPDPVPVYRHVVETELGQRSVRQEGEFIDGHAFVGHRVRFEGVFRQGTLVVHRGYNETLGVPLNFRPNSWRAMFAALLALVAIEYAVLFLAAGSALGPVG